MGLYDGEFYKTNTNIYSGNFISCSKTEILVGSPAPDRGVGEVSAVMICGAFVSGDTIKTAVKVKIRHIPSVQQRFMAAPFLEMFKSTLQTSMVIVRQGT